MIKSCWKTHIKQNYPCFASKCSLQQTCFFVLYWHVPLSNCNIPRIDISCNGNQPTKNQLKRQLGRWFWWKVSLCTWKSNPLGFGNCNVPSFCKTGLRYFCSLFTGTLYKLVSYTAELFMPKKSKLLTRESWSQVYS